MLLHIPELLNAQEVAQCRRALEQAEWEDGRKTAGHQAIRVKTNLQLPLTHPTAKAIGDLIVDRLNHHPLFVAAALPLKILPPRFNRYEGGRQYGNHIDNAIFTVTETGQRIRTDVSTTVFFSHPDEYEGGDLVVEDSYGDHTVKLPAGDALVYPGTSLHRVEPVTQGVRYASFFWTQSLVASDMQRRTLFELDGAIQRLVHDHPDHQSINELTGVYHNLLRQWSTT